MNFQYLEYDTYQFNWAEQFRMLISLTGANKNLQLEALKYDIVPTVDTDQDSPYHKIFYSKYSILEPMYTSFIKRVIYPLFNEPLLYQRIPTFRIHAPGSLGVGEFHRDRDYSHSSEEVNIFLPFTNAFGSNTIWVETREGDGDYIPLNTPYGGFWIWNGSNLEHGNKINNSGKTRISIDFRILPKRFYDESNTKQSITNKTKMVIGEYWSEYIN